MSTLKVTNAAVQATTRAAARVFTIRPIRQRRRLRTGSCVRGFLGDIFVTVFGFRAGFIDLGRLGRFGQYVGRFSVEFGRFGGFNSGVSGFRLHISGHSGYVHLSRRVASSSLGLPPQPDRAGPGAGGGGSRLRLDGLCFCFLREGQCLVRISRLARIPRRFHDAISVDYRRATPERRHSGLLVCLVLYSK